MIDYCLGCTLYLEDIHRKKEEANLKTIITNAGQMFIDGLFMKNFIEIHGLQESGRFKEEYLRLTNKVGEIYKIKKEESMKFKVGDLIKGKTDHYPLTDTRMLKGRIVKMQQSTDNEKVYPNDIEIQILEHEDHSLLENIYWVFGVMEGDFELIEKEPELLKEVKMYPLQERVLREGLHVTEIRMDEVSNKEAYFDLLPTTLNGVRGYIVDDWKNVLKPKELPDRYRVEDGAYFVEYNNGKGIVLFDILNIVRFIHRGDFISEELWKNYYSVMVKAGSRLTNIIREELKSKIASLVVGAAVRFKI